MGLYEIMLITRPDIEAEETEEALSSLTAVIAKHGGEASAVVDWRKRKLAYEINKHREGHYYLVYFSGEGTIIPELEHYFKVTDAIIRYIVVSVDEKDYAAAADKASAAAAAVEKAEADAGEADETLVVDAADDAGGTDAEEVADAEEAAEPEAEGEAEVATEGVSADDDAEKPSLEAEHETAEEKLKTEL